MVPGAVVNEAFISIAYLLTNIPGLGIKFPCLSGFSFACDLKSLEFCVVTYFSSWSNRPNQSIKQPC